MLKGEIVEFDFFGVYGDFFWNIVDFLDEMRITFDLDLDFWPWLFTLTLTFDIDLTSQISFVVDFQTKLETASVHL